LGLKIIEQLAAYELVPKTDRWYEVLAEVTHAVFHERDRFVVHPRDLTPSLLKWLLSDERAFEIARRIEANCSESPTEVETEEPGETTHLCTVDGDGNAVSLTQSIQSLFGAKVANAQLGFLYNNYLCTCKRRQHPYHLGSACIPQSNIAPTLVLRNNPCGEVGSDADVGCGGEPLLVLGAAGSRRITSAILRVISAVIDCGISLEEAVSLPRVHGLLSRNVYIERPAATEPLLRRLEKRFRKVKIKALHSYSMGAVQAIQFGHNRTLVGMADPRREGTVAAL